MSVNVTVSEKQTVNLKVTSTSTDAVALDLGNTQHNNLNGLQGGGDGSYFHLSRDQYIDLINSDNQDLYVNITGSEIITGLKTFISGIQISADSDVINITGDLINGDKTLFIDSESLVIEGAVEIKTGNLDMGTNSITNVGNIDGRDVSADGSKLDGIEALATADQTAAEIRTLVESASDSNVFTDADHSKLDAVEDGADVTPSWVPSSDPSYATETYVDTEVSNLLDSAPEALDTLNELAAALGDDAAFSTTVTNSIATKLPLAGGTMSGSINMGGNAITNVGNIDGRDVSVDGSKLDGIEDNATSDQTAAEIRTLVESATDSNVFTDDDRSKLGNIEALADVTDTTNVTAAGALMDSEVVNLADVKSFDPADYATASQGATADSAQQPPSEGAFVDGDKSKLDGIEDNATADQTAAEIRVLVDSATDSNVFTDEYNTRLDNSVTVTGTQTISGLKTFDSGFIVNAGGQDISITGNLIDNDRKLFIDAESLIVGDVNEVNSLYSAVVLGSGNSIFGDYNVIVAGADNSISGSDSTYVSDFNFVGAGSGNLITGSSYSSIVGGLENKILKDSRNSFIGGGLENRLEGSRNSVIGGGINNYVNSAESVQIFGSYVTGATPLEGYIYLADSNNRQKNATSSDKLFIDFENGVDVKTGNLTVQEDITMGGETVATRDWVEERDLGQRFDTVLSSGIDRTGIEFSTAFSSAPMVQSELQLPNGGDRTYFIAVRDITTTGFFVEFSDNIGDGYTLQTRAIPNT